MDFLFIVVLQAILAAVVLVVFGAHAIFGTSIREKWNAYPLAAMPRWHAGLLALFPAAFFLVLAGSFLFRS